MTTKDTIGKSENRAGDTYNKYNIQNVNNLKRGQKVKMLIC